MQTILNYFEEYILEYDTESKILTINKAMPINEFLILKTYIKKYLRHKIDDIIIKSIKRRY